MTYDEWFETQEPGPISDYAFGKKAWNAARASQPMCECGHLHSDHSPSRPGCSECRCSDYIPYKGGSIAVEDIDDYCAMKAAFPQLTYVDLDKWREVTK